MLGDGISARHQAGELIETRAVGHRAEADGVAEDVSTGQQHADAADGGLASTTHAVIAKVFVDVARQTGWDVDQTRVKRVVVVARQQRDRAGLAGQHVGIGIECVVAALVSHSEVEARRLDELHRVSAGDQSVEVIEAIGVRDGGGNDDAQPIFEVHRDIGQADVGAVLHIVAVDVDPDPVAERGVLVEAGIDGAVVLARRQDDDIRQQAIAVAARRGTAVGLTRAEGVVAARQSEQHLVIQAGRQALEVVAAQAIGGGRGQHLVGAVEQAVAVQVPHQPDASTRNTCFTHILDAVGIAVVPDEVTQLGSLGLDQDGLHMHASRRHRVKYHTDRFAHIRDIAVVGQGQRRQRVNICGVVLPKESSACRPILAHQLPDRTLHLAIADTGVGPIEIAQQPVDRIQVRDESTWVSEIRHGRLQEPQLIAGVDAGGVDGGHINIDPHINAPTVVERARGREQRVVDRRRSDGHVKQAGLFLHARVGDANRDGSRLIHR